MRIKSQYEYENAKSEYEKTLQLEPDNVHTHIALAELHFNQGKLGETIDCCAHALTLDFRNARIHTLLGIVYYEKGLLDRAEEHYEIALSITPGDSKLHNNIGVIYLEKGLWDKAIQSFRMSLNIQQDSKTHSNLGVALFEKGLKDEGKIEFEEAVRIDPDEITAHYYLGAEYQRKGEWKVGSLLKIGQVLKMHPLGEVGIKEYGKVYSVRIEDMDEGSITIGAPLERGVPVPLRTGMRLIVGTSREDALYGFHTEIMDRKGGMLPVFKISKSETARRVQRRNFVRVPTNVDVSITILKPEELSKKSLLDSEIIEKNISAGGMLIVSALIIPLSAELVIRLRLPDGPAHVKGKVVRSKKMEEKSHHEVGISFHNLNDATRTQITRYVYSRQVELRRKGLA